jgi:hypothetical protein
LNRVLQFTKDLNPILDEINLFESNSFIEQGHEHINYELQRYEMKEYIELLNDTKRLSLNFIIINCLVNIHVWKLLSE